MSRRNFIKQTGIMAGGLLLHSELSQAFNILNPIGVLNIGVIGCGDRGKGLMAVMTEAKDLFKITAICDVLDFRLKEARRMVPGEKLTEYQNYRQLLDDKRIDAVIIAVPLNMHFQIAADALAAAKHIYLEKTMTYNIPQAQNLVALAAKHQNQVLQVGHQYRYTPLYFKVKEMIEKGYLGKVVQIDCRWDRNWNWRRAVPEASLERKINWRMYKEYSGGLVAELLSHQIDFINWAFDTHPDQILAAGGIDYYKDGRETFDNVQVLFRYAKDGMIGNFGATCGNAHDGYIFRIKGTKGMVSLLMDEGIYYPEKDARKELETVDGVTGATKITWNKDGGIPILKEKTRDGSWYALTDFYQCITQKKQPVSNVYTGATTAVCVHLANQALYNSTPEIWKPAYNFHKQS